MLKQLFKLFSSLKLTVVCLVLGCVIVFWGTIAQVHLGLFKAQNEFFRSFFVYWTPPGSGFHVPIFPGGYFIGTVLLINLFVAHFRYYQPGKRKIGIVLIHFGIVLLLVGQMLTDFLSRESSLHCASAKQKITPRPTAPLNWRSWIPPTRTPTRLSPSPAACSSGAAR
jgi:hypothetical protein